MNLHTPGPWKNEGYHAGNRLVHSSNGHLIAHVVEPVFNTDPEKGATISQAVYNARLITAAPEMFAILTEILAEWEQDWQGEEPRELSDLELRVQQVMHDIWPERNLPEPESEPDYTGQSF